MYMYAFICTVTANMKITNRSDIGLHHNVPSQGFLRKDSARLVYYLKTFSRKAVEDWFIHKNTFYGQENSLPRRIVGTDDFCSTATVKKRFICR